MIFAGGSGVAHHWDETNSISLMLVTNCTDGRWLLIEQTIGHSNVDLDLKVCR